MSEPIELPHIDRIDYVGGSYPMASKPEGEYVEYDDHVEIVRQLAEQRAELLEALNRAQTWVQNSDPHAAKFIASAIANATQQRNATGGEG